MYMIRNINGKISVIIHYDCVQCVSWINLKKMAEDLVLCPHRWCIGELNSRSCLFVNNMASWAVKGWRVQSSNEVVWLILMEHFSISLYIVHCARWNWGCLISCIIIWRRRNFDCSRKRNLQYNLFPIKNVCNLVLKLVNYHMFQCYRKLVWQYYISCREKNNCYELWLLQQKRFVASMTICAAKFAIVTYPGTSESIYSWTHVFRFFSIFWILSCSINIYSTSFRPINML
jgi:hypothetical protein